MLREISILRMQAIFIELLCLSGCSQLRKNSVLNRCISKEVFMSNDIEKQKSDLKDELDALNYEFKFELPKKIAEAREHGDLKENADYHAARERQGFVRAKIAQLADQLAKLSNIDINTISTDKVGFGSKVSVYEEGTGNKIDFIFVPDGEMKPSEGKITLNTPYGKALAGKKVGDTVEVVIPAGKRTFKITNLITIHGNEITE